MTTDKERMDTLRIAWRGLVAKVREHQSEIPADTVQRFGDSARAFLAAYGAESFVDDSALVSVVYSSDAVRSLYQTYAGWAGLLAEYVGRSPLPSYEETALYNATVEVENTIKDAGSTLFTVAVIAIGLYLFANMRE